MSIVSYILDTCNGKIYLKSQSFHYFSYIYSQLLQFKSQSPRQNFHIIEKEGERIMSYSKDCNVDVGLGGENINYKESNEDGLL